MKNQYISNFTSFHSKFAKYVAILFGVTACVIIYSAMVLHNDTDWIIMHIAYWPVSCISEVICRLDGITSTESANSVNQITNQSGTSTSFTYDPAGNETSKIGSSGSTVFDWDGANRCTAIESADSQFGIAYDGLNRWIHITQCDSDCTNLLADRWFIWNGNSLAEERDLCISSIQTNSSWENGTYLIVKATIYKSQTTINYTCIPNPSMLVKKKQITLMAIFANQQLSVNQQPPQDWSKFFG